MMCPWNVMGISSYIHHILQSSEASQILLLLPLLVVPTLPAFDPYPLASNWITMILMIQAYTSSVLFGLVDIDSIDSY